MRPGKGAARRDRLIFCSSCLLSCCFACAYMENHNEKENEMVDNA